MEKCIGVEWVTGFDDFSHLVLLSKTGVFYSDQCGGISCYHPKFEGYCIKGPDIDFGKTGLEDCDYICGQQYDQFNKNFFDLAVAIDNYLKSDPFIYRLNLKFDFNRIKYLLEGCWPILVSGIVDDWFDFGLEDAEAILFVGNCD